jgi:hypothetical protein
VTTHGDHFQVFDSKCAMVAQITVRSQPLAASCGAETTKALTNIFNRIACKLTPNDTVAQGGPGVGYEAQVMHRKHSVWQ